MNKELKVKKIIEDIRINWAINDKNRDENFTTPSDITRFDNISYGEYNEFNLLDVYVKKGVTKPQATIVNVHGGAFVYGNKEVYQYYCMDLAERGFTVVNINYRLAPEYKYPSPIIDINNVLNWIYNEGDNYFIDKTKLILIGDSAGANLVSYYATIFTNKELANKLNLTIPNVNIISLGLDCGLYNNKVIASDTLDDLFIEYLGYTNKKLDNEILDKIDTFKYVNRNYPPSFIYSSYEDFLLSEARPFYDLLISNNVIASLTIYGKKGNKEVGHVFNVNFILDEAKKCNNDQCEFYKKFI